MEKNSKKRPKLGLGALIASLLIILAVFVIILFANKPENMKKAKGTVVCSFYPVYDMVSNLMEGTHYDIVNMTSGLTGCIHDYQITTKDMKAVEAADLFVANGMGMEHFVEKIAGTKKTLPIIFATDCLDGSDIINHSADGDEDCEENSHVWMDPSMLKEELNYLKEALSKQFPDEAESISSNLNRYERTVLDCIDKASEIKTKLQDLKNPDGLPEKINCISFNEAFVPLIESLGMNCLADFSLDENETPSANAIKDAIENANKETYVLVLIEKDKEKEAEKILAETNAVCVCIDPLTASSNGDDLPTGLWKDIVEIEAAVENLLK